ncbi:ap-4-a phosphorylase ii [Anaeramoeba flamelloides]|uniref:Ap-4-a phosphorylase ii n=1 Tax=Anaeramoeba flamelloides TaxID=1746091 RepID=A0ABQ8YGK6_9EUKA|nr:ap-4-a phosphorylase ii [Anaeramoeba flamelloides]
MNTTSLTKLINKKYSKCFEFLSQTPTIFNIIKTKKMEFLIWKPTPIKIKSLSEPVKLVTNTSKAKKRDPFQYPSKDPLFITKIDEDFSLLFNKFYLVPKHLVLVTNKFVHQNTPLDLAIFKPALRILKVNDGLAFFNHGRESGMSQPHKHVQFLPLPLLDKYNLPIEGLINKAGMKYKERQIFELPVAYKNAVCKLDRNTNTPEKLLLAYHSLLDHLKIRYQFDEEQTLSDQSYNWLCTQNWMMIVPRSNSFLENGLGINSIGYVGSYFLRSLEQAKIIKEYGPLNTLIDLGLSKNL